MAIEDDGVIRGSWDHQGISEARIKRAVQLSQNDRGYVYGGGADPVYYRRSYA